MQFISELRPACDSLVFAALWPCPDPKYLSALAALGITAYSGAEELSLYGIRLTQSWSIRNILAQHEIDLVVLTLWFWDYLSMPEHYMASIRDLSSRSIVVVLTDDRHGLRQQQAAAAYNSPVLAESAADYLQREAAVYQASDIVLAIADAEQDSIRALSPGTLTIVIPFAAPSQNTIGTLSGRSGILFLANFLNPAAQDGAGWFLREAWTTIQQRIPRARLTLAGTFSRQFMRSPPPGIECLGHVASLTDLFNSHRVFVSPVRFGTGISTRNILSMSFGLPVVTTPCGVQSLGADDGFIVFSCETSEEIAAAIVRLCSEDELWQRLSAASRHYIAERFSVESLRRGVQEFVVVASGLEVQGKSKPQFSCRIVDDNYPELHSKCDRRESARWRRLLAYIDLGEEFIRHKEYESALRQFRHACSLLQTDQLEAVLVRINRGLHDCYRELGVTTVLQNPALTRVG
jgi:hypothetical protein